MIKYIKGDLFATDADIIAHGVNCQGKFESGIAGIIKQKYPKARQYYLDKYEDEGWNLGDVQYVKIGSGDNFIANCATQDTYLPRGICHVDYNAIRQCMENVKRVAKLHGYTVAIPKIGAGLAGGDWNIIEKIINKVFDDYPIICYYID
jgi:O-acetyl-ADP-ribose deacetylase (regulator of RNase III)